MVFEGFHEVAKLDEGGPEVCGAADQWNLELEAFDNRGHHG